ncbi:hypothetical protein SeMB42_g00237 [Synchytrium endobioticum]|uniref:Uncharacterized protein n=1 Tax=Synchytrium endobioticum TaxID=286115 RepID=A0A507DS40_9FUNG|nr:hypothetical protein SeMB42_g00237 [Synchytrium endobioticum]
MPVHQPLSPACLPQSMDKDAPLWEPYKYLLSLGGKGIRNKLMDAFNHYLHVSPAKLGVIKTCIEMLHNASLLIDDIEDNSSMRRGKPSAHVKYGLPSTINTGNLCYFFTLQNVLKAYEDDKDMCINMMRAFTEEMVQLHRGQGFELHWRDHGECACPSMDEYRDMVSNKTGGLLRLGVKMMQYASGSDKNLVEIADLIGVHFQIRDDYLNLASTKYTDAKGFCEDLSEGKFSYPIIHSIQSSSDQAQELLRIVRSKPTDVATKLRALELIQETKSLEQTESVIDALDAQITEELLKLGGNPILEKVMTILREEYTAARKARIAA